MGEIRHDLTVLKTHGTKHDKSIREFTADETGMRISGALKNVSDILSRTPAQHFIAEANKYGDMFDAD